MSLESLYNYKGRVMRVIDGDTMDVEIDLGFGIKRLERVRLAGIDTPEIRTKDADEKAAGNAALEFVVDWVKMNGSVFLRTVKDNDKYGRYLAFVSSQSDPSTSLNNILVHKGLAVLYED